jgi:hypothetical protein
MIPSDRNQLPELTDDGLRLRLNTKTKAGGYRLVAYENPEHTAYAVAVKRERQLIREANERKMS